MNSMARASTPSYRRTLRRIVSAEWARESHPARSRCDLCEGVPHYFIASTDKEKAGSIPALALGACSGGSGERLRPRVEASLAILDGQDRNDRMALSDRCSGRWKRRARFDPSVSIKDGTRRLAGSLRGRHSELVARHASVGTASKYLCTAVRFERRWKFRGRSGTCLE